MGKLFSRITKPDFEKTKLKRLEKQKVKAYLDKYSTTNKVKIEYLEQMYKDDGNTEINSDIVKSDLKKDKKKDQYFSDEDYIRLKKLFSLDNNPFDTLIDKKYTK